MDLSIEMNIFDELHNLTEQLRRNWSFSGRLNFNLDPNQFQTWKRSSGVYKRRSGEGKLFRRQQPRLNSSAFTFK